LKRERGSKIGTLEIIAETTRREAGGLVGSFFGKGIKSGVFQVEGLLNFFLLKAYYVPNSNIRSKFTRI
jgi:hypothetical protein